MASAVAVLGILIVAGCHRPAADSRAGSMVVWTLEGVRSHSYAAVY
jgi:hypothetical protein